ncbi:NAD(P)H dehydrogenase (quinone) [Pectobacterium parmentieri WPP163]|uniref:NAD(P)H-dependent oxidoreductase n=1 Tax=Pectobacterium parmentieri TaxID=1905730 RepID=UPI0001B0E109|nr:NAD(P)H-dependent oxidoreductase [Pectobacterium parmentieri]ACX88820.1 NAD(P)H dehydrogenase (quinone) [Pectobacterium parmentieri WPP163]
MKILHIDSSILGDYSVSRQLSADIVVRLRELHPGSEVVYRDLVEDAVGHLSGAYMAVIRGGGNPDPQLSDEIAHGDAYINDLFAAEIIVIGAPMYNFTVSSQLKTWIDRVEIGGGILLLIGYHTRVVALVLSAFTVATAVFFHHNFADQNAMINFLKNIIIVGGLLQIVAFGPSKFSLDARRH